MSNYPRVNYIGNKEKLADWIISEMPVDTGVVLDIFAGGCSVSYALKEKGYSVIANDILYADYTLAKALIENTDETLNLSVFEETVTSERIDELCEKFAFLRDRLYYPEEIQELARLAAISENLSGNQKYLFLSLLRRAMIRKLPYSRMNVPWNQIQRLRDEEYSYEKYGRKRAYHNQTFENHMRENFAAYNSAVFSGSQCRAFNFDVSKMADQIDEVDVVYMDPPYPSTMNNYDEFYGLFDEMFDKKKQHTDFTQRSYFLENLDMLVQKLVGKTKYIVLSQNTRVQPGPEEIEKMLSKYGKVVVKEKKHNYQVTGKENKRGSKEVLFVLTMGGKRVGRRNNPKKAKENQQYDKYWKLTVEYTDIHGSKFLGTLKIIVDFIDAHEFEINKCTNVQNRELQDSLASIYHKQDKGSIRKSINQFIKLGFVMPGYKGYHRLTKKFLNSTNKRERELLFTQIFYEAGSVSSSYSTDNTNTKEVNFLLKTLAYSGPLKKRDLTAIMVTDISGYKRGYMLKEELEEQYRYAQKINFEEKKYNQITYLIRFLKYMPNLIFENNELRFEDQKAEIMAMPVVDKTRDPIMYRIYREGVFEESYRIYGRLQCCATKLPQKGLVTSHIKPLGICLNEGRPDEAYDSNNGLLLAPNIDAYFDKFDITFNPDGKIQIGKFVESEVADKIKEIYLDEAILNKPRKQYLAFHNIRFNEKNK